MGTWWRVLGTGLVGAALATWWFRVRVLPARPDDAGRPRARPLPEGVPVPAPDGDGVRIVVNPSSGPAWSGSCADELREALPGADVVELGEGDDLVELLGDERFPVVGAAGGDGTVAAAAAVARDRDVPLVLVPGGTLNHLARDVGLESAADAVAAVRAGTAAPIDLGLAGDRVFVNTLSFGGYSMVVDTRERLEGRLGKWLALVVALVRELPRMEPLRTEVDGERVDVWLGWVGNCAYGPPGLAPAWRDQLDDGLLDVRLLEGGRPRARTRFVLAALRGRLAEVDGYREARVEELHVRFLDGVPRLAADGETYDGPADLRIGKARRAVRVAVCPGPED